MKAIVTLGVLMVLVVPATASAGGWLPIPARYGPQIRQAIMEPTVKASNGKARISLCTLSAGNRFYTCVFGEGATVAKAAVEVERTGKCDYRIYLVDVRVKPAKVTHQTSFHYCFK